MEGARVAVVRSVQGKLADVGSRALGAGGASMVKLARCACIRLWAKSNELATRADACMGHSLAQLHDRVEALRLCVVEAAQLADLPRDNHRLKKVVLLLRDGDARSHPWRATSTWVAQRRRIRGRARRDTTWTTIVSPPAQAACIVMEYERWHYGPWLGWLLTTTSLPTGCRRSCCPGLSTSSMPSASDSARTCNIACDIASEGRHHWETGRRRRRASAVSAHPRQGSRRKVSTHAALVAGSIALRQGIRCASE